MPIPTDPNKRHFMFSDDMKFLQKAIVFHPEDEGKLLALKRSPNDVSRPGKWDLVGGNVSYGEEALTCLKREIREEAGLEVKDIKPITVWSKFFDDTKVYHLFIGYVCKAVTSNVALSHEHTEYRWVTKEEFLQLDSAEFLMEMVNLF